jgi:transposase
LTDDPWEVIVDLFDPPGRRGEPAQIPWRQMVDLMFFVGRSGCQWRANGAGARAMSWLATVVRSFPVASRSRRWSRSMPGR